MKGQWYGSYIFPSFIFSKNKSETWFVKYNKIIFELPRCKPRIGRLEFVFFWFPYINPYAATVCSQNQSFGSYPCPKIAICSSPKKWLGDFWHVPSLQGEDRNLLISSIRMFDVNTIILHEFKAHGRLGRLTGTLQKTLQSLGSPMGPKSHGKFQGILGCKEGCYAKFGVCFYEKLEIWNELMFKRCGLYLALFRSIPHRHHKKTTKGHQKHHWFRNLNPCGCWCHLPTSYESSS